MRGQVAETWHAATDDGKLALLKRALVTGIPLDVELLDEEPAVLDGLATQVGLVPVYVATVDGCGLSCTAPAVVSPATAQQYRQRTLR